MLETLDQADLFLIALDQKRHWYRYHHLFAHVLRNRLRLTYPAVKSHVNHIYGKLGVTSRSQAIARAHALQIG
jgi:ATP/maltotriose-dependent transcriptional regulator MalT